MKTTRVSSFVPSRAHVHGLRHLLVAVLLGAGALAQAQEFAGLPATLVLYSNQTVTTAFTLNGWNGSNVAVTVAGPATNLLASYAVDPADGTNTSRNLVTTGGTVGGASTLRLIAAETPAAVHTVTGTVSVTVRAQPTVAYATTNGFHDGHIEQESTVATLTVTRNAAATVLWGRHSNTVLFPATNIYPKTGSVLGLIPNPMQAGTDTFTVYVTDSFGGWTNSIAVVLTVEPVPIIKELDASLTFDEDTWGTNAFTVSYAGNTNRLTYAATFSPTNLIQTHTFLTVGGVSTNRALELRPYAHANGSATCSVIVSDGTHARTNTFAITVNAVPDPTTLTGMPAEILLSSKAPWTNVFAAAAFADPDDGRPSEEKLDVSIREPLLQIVFADSAANAVSNINAKVSDQTAWFTAITLKAADNLFGVMGSTNDIPVTVIARSRNDQIAITNTMIVHLFFENTPPDFLIGVAPGQGEMTELESRTPFTLDRITDPDDTQTSFTLSLFLAPGYEAYGTLSKNVGEAIPPGGGVIGTGNRAELDLLLRNTQFSAAQGVLRDSQGPVAFVFMLHDGFDTAFRTNTITLNQLRRPPVINLGNGAPRDIYVTSAAAEAEPYPSVYVSDPDEAGGQPVRAAISASPDIGDIDMITQGAMGTLQSPADLTAVLRKAVFTPDAAALDAIAVGQSISTRLTLSVTDETGLTDTDSDVVIHIERVNAPPELGVPDEQPVLFSPGAVLRPFAEVTLASDDTNAVTFSFSIDNPAKGTFGNVDVGPSGFSAQGAGSYAITTASIGHILNLLTNITFTPSGTYPFPPDDPYGTRFTLSAKDYQLLTTTRTLAIQVQDPPRNWLVTKQVNDGTPGTFQHALAHVANNDVITFALPSYPATIRMSAAHAVIETGRTLTIKGPGADLLTISGDADGNGTPDRQILAIDSSVTIEGVTFAEATAPVGGALAVLSANGKLVLRNVVIRDSVATQYGGAIDVYGGRLSAEGCAFLRNTVTAEGYGGGAISTYTDFDIGITNTLFDSNAQLSPNGAGGAIFAELIDGSSDDFAAIEIVHCTFADNVDASVDYTASSVYACSGTYVFPRNTLFADSPVTRTLNLDSGAAIWSLGGNVCDDSTYVPYQQQWPDGSYSNYLLDSDVDRLGAEARLAPLDTASSVVPYRLPLTNSPAIGFALPSSATVLDQRGRLRTSRVGGLGVSGAIDPAAVSWPVITEIQLSGALGDTDRFIEIFAPRNGQEVNLAGYALFVNGVAVHEFGRGRLALTNSVYTSLVASAAVPASYVLAPGRGVVVVFPEGAVADLGSFSALNPTPVVRGSLVTNAAAFGELLSRQGRGSVAIATSETAAPIVRQTFLAVFNDPDSAAGTNVLDTAHNSIASAPQARGFAFLPHSSVSTEIHGGWRGRPEVTPSAILLQSPGATVDGIPFGLTNATPRAVSDGVALTEDDVGVFAVLANDLDPDGNDRLVVVDVSALSAPDTNEAATALSTLGADVAVLPAGSPLRGNAVSYDPRHAAVFQALPVGVEILDTFFYEIVDFGFAAVDEIAEGTSSNTWVTAKHHRLVTGDVVKLSGVSVSAYNGTNAVVVLDENTFAIPVAFGTAAVVPGVWETVAPRHPTARSEATVTVRVTGVNDAPAVVADVVTNVTEASTVRIMVRPELANTVLSMPEDPVPAPLPNPAHLLDNDYDVDADDTWQTLRLVGVMGTVHTIQGYAGTVGEAPVTVLAPAHGLTSGTEVLIANYGGHPSYNGYHTVTVLDADSFTIPAFFKDNASEKGMWVVLNDGNRYHAVTDVGATVDLTLRASPVEDYLIYDAAASAFLNTLSEGQRYTNRFYQAVMDSHGAIGIGSVDVVVVGLNDTPVALPDPDGLSVLAPLVTPSNTLGQVLSDGLDILYTLPPASETAGRLDVQTLDRSGVLPGTVVLPDLWTTDEDTAITLEAPALVLNDSDIDMQDDLNVLAVDPFSRAGAAVSLTGGQITYDPSAAADLQALARDEWVIDSFYAAITDSRTGGTVTSLVAVLVTGRNDTPVAQPDAIAVTEDDVFAFDPMRYPADTPARHDYDLDRDGQLPDDRLSMIAVSNLITVGEARVDIGPFMAQYDATISARLNQLADWQTYTDTFEYTISDNSFLFVVDDEFHVPADTVARTLDVLANDRDFTPLASTLTIVDVGPTLRGGTVTIAPDGRRLVYTSPAGVAVDDYFRYVVEGAAGNRRSARVLVRSVIPPLNGILCAASDHFAVAYGETAVLNVLANDQMLPAGEAGLMLTTNVVETSIPGQPVASGNTFVYTATNGLSPLTFTYEVSAGGSSVARAAVVVDIVDRRHTLPVQGDTFSVSVGSSDTTLDVLANDSLITGATGHLRIAGLVQPPAFGTAVTNASATALLYTPPAGFVGVERLCYLATDTLGSTGTGVVSISVGKIDTVIDFFAVEASTNGATVSLDVLANDLVQPATTGALTLVSVTPASTAIGDIQVSGAGARLEFVASNTVGQMSFVYQVSDSTARTATGSVTVATVPAGIYANTDRFLVRGGGANYELNVLANDRSYPDINKSYTLIGIGTGAEAPSAGGSVSIADNKLRYTPAAGFVGQESFTYTMSDSVSTDSAWVTVTVSPGDLFANADRYSVCYELEGAGPAARAFVLPVVRNDRIQPPLGQTVQITGLGVGPNAPDRLGAVTIGADGISLVYRPVEVPATSYVERFTYEISDGTERRASAVVEVEVLNRVGALQAVTQDDAFTVARGSSNNVLPLLRNDFVLPGMAAGWVITAVSATAHDGIVSNDGAQVFYTPAAEFVGLDTFTYDVNDGLGGTGSATVHVRVGSRPTLPDRFVALSGSVSNAFDVVANDVLSADYASEYPLLEVFGATQGGTVLLAPSNTVRYTPDAAYAGPYPYIEGFSYSVADDAAGAVTGVVQVTVYETGSDRSTTGVTVQVTGRNDIPVITNTAPNPAITDKETARPFTGVTVTEVDQQTIEPIDVLVWLDDPVKGTLQELGGFVDLGGGQYRLNGVTAAEATAQLRGLLFVPTENRIPVPTSEGTRFTVSVTDTKSDPVTNAQSVVTVTAANDPPLIAGTRAGQTVYAATAIRLFASVTLTEIDDVTLQPLAVTIQLSNPTHGILRQLGSFVSQGDGRYAATGLTAAQATTQLRQIEFLHGAYQVPTNAPKLTVFTLTVNDGYAPPVTDSQTSVLAYNAFEGSIRPTNTAQQATFGFAVDTISQFAVVGAPGANMNGTDSGLAFVYRAVPGTTNTWELWRQLQPPSVESQDQFGYAVSISDELIAVGAVKDEVGGAEVGAVYLFQRHLGGTNNWGQLLRIAPTNLPAGSRFGFSVDLDGDLLAVGAPKATLSGSMPAEGAVFLFGRNRGGPGAWGEIMRWEPRNQSSVDCGWSVSVNGDRLAAGAPQNKWGTPESAPKGAVFCFSRDAGGPGAWGLSQTIRFAAITNASGFGHSVSIDGNTLAVGAPMTPLAGGSNNAGEVHVFEFDGAAWARISQIDVRADSDRRFGYSVSVNKDFIFVGAPGFLELSDTGSAYLFRRDAPALTTWSQIERFLRPATNTALSFAAAVSFKQDVAIVGTSEDLLLPADFPGRAFMFRFKFNNAPVVVDPVPDQFAEWDEPFSYTVPSAIFADPDVGDTLTVLPALTTTGHGLSVSDMTVSGTPTVIGAVPVEVVATDASGATAVDPFDILVLVDGVWLDPTPRNQWNVDYFGKDTANPLLEGTVWGGLANRDGDPANNDREYAFGGDPTVGDNAGVITLTILPDGNMLITYVRRKDDPDLEFTLQGTPTLVPAAWADVQALTVGERATALSDAYERVEVTVSVPDAGPMMFFRVLVTP